MSNLTVQDYCIGWICALNEELTAALAMLDEEHEMIAGQDKQDHNSYVVGRIHQHNVVIAGMPEGVDGLVSAANVAKDMARTFPALRVGLMVGIGGGIPNLHRGIDIRLGDIVVSRPEKTFGGVIQYDKVKAESGGRFVVKGQLNQPPALLLQTITQLRARHAMRPNRVSHYINEAVGRNPTLEHNGFTRPTEPDSFYCSLCDNNIQSPTAECTGPHAKRKQRRNNEPVVHYGVIASGNQVVKDSLVRDRLQDEFGALCVEMEAAGLMNNFPCLVIRGICDYADSYKNDAWHPYAAMTAAAYAKELLQYISPAQASQEQPVQAVLGLLNDIHNTSKAQLEATQAQTQQNKAQYVSDKHRRCLQAFKVSAYQQQKDNNPERADGTCQWVLSHDQYLRWTAKANDDLLWISADPGCGKSVLARSLVDNELKSNAEHTVCYFFFKDNEEQGDLATALCALLHQLLSQQPRLIEYAMPMWEKAGDKIVKDIPELWEMLLTAARGSDAHNVTCVFDALDECRPTHRRSLISMLTSFYTRISSLSSNKRRNRLKFLITSRPYDDIQAEFHRTLGDLPTIRLRGERENDQIHQEIDLVIRLQVDKVAQELRLDLETKEHLTKSLLGMEHRTYLWLYLAIDGIYQTYRRSLRPKEALIESLPSTVEDAYEKILARVPKEQQNDVEKILLIVVGARRPFTIQEMAIALGLATSTRPKSMMQAQLDPVWLERNICDWCGLFVFINHNRVYLIHQTAKEFLVRDRSSRSPLAGWKHCLSSCKIEEAMARICTGFMLLEDVEPVAKMIIKRVYAEDNDKDTGQDTDGDYDEDSAEDDIEDYDEDSYVDIDENYKIKEVVDENNHIESFLLYSAEHWPQHFRDADIPTNDAFVAYTSCLYDINGNVRRLWVRVQNELSSLALSRLRMKSLQLMAHMGHDNVLERALLSNDGLDIDTMSGSGYTALTVACRTGYEKTVRMLLDRGADVNAGWGIYGNALYTASEHGYEKVVQMLLDNSADVNAQMGIFGNALYAASVNGYEKVVQILLDRGADVNAQRGFRGNALCAASEHGYKKVVQMLLDNGADVNAPLDGLYETALHWALKRKRNRVVRILLDRGADVGTLGTEDRETLKRHYLVATRE